MNKMKVASILSLTVLAFLSGIVYFSHEEETIKSKETTVAIENSALLAMNDSANKATEEVMLDNEIDNINKELLALEDEVEVVHEEAISTYYHDKFNGRKTASGEIFNNEKMTAAHKTLPLGTRVRVTNIANEESVIVVINDRGPFIKGKHLDLSKAAFMQIAHRKTHGNLKVKVEILPDGYEETKAELIDDLQALVQIEDHNDKINLSEFSL